ncbi:MAG: gliding motility-associated protein GldE [Bacteroidales bacterium]|nr:gliding motility-associated protein GldE [Bacteroidales bacterium]
MEADPYLSGVIFLNLDITVNQITFGAIIGVIVIIILLIASALISGSEVAYFSLSPTNIKYLKNQKSKSCELVIKLLNNPKRLLGTILVSNNFVNVGIIILSAYVISALVDFSNSPTLGFIIKVIIITFFLLLFGEIIPKIYATQYSLRFAVIMAYPILVLGKIFSPISSFLIYSTSIVNKKFQRKQDISIDDLSTALDLTASSLNEERELLKGIVEFGNIDVNEIIKSRVDVVAVDINTKFKKLLKSIINSGYSRIPVYSETFDNVKGILFIKDLLPHIQKSDSFRWQTLIRPPYIVPEKKKISELLEEFQKNKIHMAIVVDEYGGTAGIVTMEDVLEEIIGEIQDEFDEEEIIFKKLDDKNYIFEGKTLLNDFYKIIHSNPDIFGEVKGDADTLAGLILEIKGEIPSLNDEIIYDNYIFKIVEVDNRRIKKIKTTIK